MTLLSSITVSITLIWVLATIVEAEDSCLAGASAPQGMADVALLQSDGIYQGTSRRAAHRHHHHTNELRQLSASIWKRGVGPSINMTELKLELSDMPFQLANLQRLLVFHQHQVLHQQKHNTSADRKPVLYIHIHKAGGTTMCYLAGVAGEHVVQPNGNCNDKQHDMWRNSGHPEGALSCEARARLFADRGFTWGAIEREVWPSDMCPNEFMYATLLRDPMALMLSMVKFHPEVGKEFLQRLREQLNGHKSTDASQDAEGLWKVFDNYQTRILADAMGVRAGEITDEHVKKAKRMLSKFSAVSRLEDVSNDHSFFEKLGWSADIMRTNEGRHNAGISPITFTSEEEAWLMDLNRHDSKLYEASKPAGKF